MKKAFSLVELIVVMVIISVGLGTLMLVLRQANVNNAYSHFITVAAQLTRGKIDEILYHRTKMDFDHIVDGAYTDEDPPSNIGYGNYKREVDIGFVNLSNLNKTVGSQTDYKRIKVTVTRRGDISASDKVELVTIISGCE